MRKNDIFLGIIVLVVAAVGFLFFMNPGKPDSGVVKITVDGKLFGTYSLDKDQEVFIDNTNCLIIKDGKADMIEADCPDQICVDHKPISKNKETIVCLPNKVIVEVTGAEEPELDAVTD